MELGKVLALLAVAAVAGVLPAFIHPNGNEGFRNFSAKLVKTLIANSYQDFHWIRKGGGARVLSKARKELPWINSFFIKSQWLHMTCGDVFRKRALFSTFLTSF